LAEELGAADAGEPRLHRHAALRYDGDGDEGRQGQARERRAEPTVVLEVPELRIVDQDLWD